MPENPDRPTRRRRALFAAASIGLGLVALALVELGLRTAGLGGRPPLFIPAPERAGWLQANPRVAERWVSGDVDLGIAIEPIPFRAEKPPDLYRIVVQGGSTAAGFPYGRWGGLAGMLGDRLDGELPEREIEVITTAMAAVNSNALVDLVDEIVAIEPDAVLVYAGHNEYVGVQGVASALTPVREEQRLTQALRSLGLYQLLERLVASLRVSFRGGDDPMPLFERAASASQVPFGSLAYERGIEQLDRNLGALLARYREVGIPVYVGTLVSNLRGLPPFVPGPRPETDPDAWRRARERAGRASAGDRGASRQAIASWIAVDSRAAGPWFAMGRHLESHGDRRGARAAYERARDLDPLRFRAPGAFNARIRALAAAHEARLVDVAARFARESTAGIPGDELLLEHVHPNAEGYFLLADAFRDALAADGRIGAWPPDDEARARSDLPITAIDRARVGWDMRAMRASFPFRDPPESVPAPEPRGPVERLALRHRDGEIHWLEAMEGLVQLQQERGRLREAATVARLVAQAYPLEAQPNLAAGLLLLKTGQPRRAVRYLERSLEASPDDARARSALARARRSAPASPP